MTTFSLAEAKANPRDLAIRNQSLPANEFFMYKRSSNSAFFNNELVLQRVRIDDTQAYKT